MIEGVIIIIKFNLKNGILSIHHQIVIIIIMFGYSIAYYLDTRDLSYEALLFPKILLLGILVFGILSLKDCISFTRTENAKKADQAEENGEAPERITKKWLKFIAAIIVVVALFEHLGGLVTMFVFILVSMYMAGVRRKLILVLVPLFTVLFIYFVFQVWLSVALPLGVLRFILG
jgi:hypothetical protein